MSNLKALRELIIAANPKQLSRSIIPDNCGCSTVIFTLPEPITLAEILMAIDFGGFTIRTNKKEMIFRLNTGFLGQDIIIIWDLSKDLGGQSPETIQKLLTLMEKQND